MFENIGCRVGWRITVISSSPSTSHSFLKTSTIFIYKWKFSSMALITNTNDVIGKVKLFIEFRAKVSRYTRTLRNDMSRCLFWIYPRVWESRNAKTAIFASVQETITNMKCGLSAALRPIQDLSPFSGMILNPFADNKLLNSAILRWSYWELDSWWRC